MAELARVIGILDGLWREHGLGANLQADLNIAVEEILSNVIRHGGGAELIQLLVQIAPGEVRIEIRDRGVPFDPLAQPAPDVKLPVEQRRRGGLGILMTMQLMDRTRYERLGGWNCFTMEKSRG